jgi:hypothetical protein
MATPVSITDEQTVEVGVNGPGDITRMFIVTGIANTSLTAYEPLGGGSSSASQTFEALVGPTLAPNQFRRAVATASLAGIQGYGENESLELWNVHGVDADFDDDANRVQVQFDVQVAIAGTVAGTYSASSSIYGVGFQVVVLAAV